MSFEHQFCHSPPAVVDPVVVNFLRQFFPLEVSKGFDYTRYHLPGIMPVIRAIGVSHTARKDEFRQNLQSHSWSVFYFYNISVPGSTYWSRYNICTHLMRSGAAVKANLSEFASS